MDWYPYNLKYNSFDIEINPNPVANYLNLNIKTQANTKFYVEIFDIYGIKISNYEIQSNQLNNLQTDNLQTGLYLLMVHNQNDYKTVKFLKNK